MFTGWSVVVGSALWLHGWLLPDTPPQEPRVPRLGGVKMGCVLGSGKGQQRGNGVLFHNLNSSNTQSRSLIIELVQKESAVQGIIGTSIEQILFWVLCC